jgi:hypothetical protein
MALTRSEELRLQAAELKVAQLGHLVEGTGSKNQLNRLLVLCQEETRNLTVKLENLEEEMSTLLALARKLQ